MESMNPLGESGRMNPLGESGPSRRRGPVGKQRQEVWSVVGMGKLGKEEAPVPWPAPESLLLRLRAAGLSRSDLRQRDAQVGAGPGEASVLGIEVAGEVVAVGEGVTDWDEGDQVIALVPSNGLSLFLLAPAKHCLPLPSPAYAWPQAAALPLGLAAAWAALFDVSKLSGGSHL
mmetsp:Transcript_22817/g.35727  ORF Transcript_22817/g.35727 Transcript_22817/m.35727 type:complete len:174 (+) Transcript_22817:341-862(+)